LLPDDVLGSRPEAHPGSVFSSTSVQGNGVEEVRRSCWKAFQCNGAIVSAINRCCTGLETAKPAKLSKRAKRAKRANACECLRMPVQSLKN